MCCGNPRPVRRQTPSFLAAAGMDAGPPRLAQGDRWAMANLNVLRRIAAMVSAAQSSEGGGLGDR
jgi:hypothetical protein